MGRYCRKGPGVVSLLRYAKRRLRAAASASGRSPSRALDRAGSGGARDRKDARLTASRPAAVHGNRERCDTLNVAAFDVDSRKGSDDGQGDETETDRQI